MNTRFLTALAMLLLLGLAVPALADKPSASDWAMAGVKKPAQGEAFLDKLRKAVATGDKAAVAALAEYPMAVQIGDNFDVEDAGQFVRRYEGIITRGVREAVLNGSVSVNPRGVVRLVGDGAEMWIMKESGGLRIITVIE